MGRNRLICWLLALTVLATQCHAAAPPAYVRSNLFLKVVVLYPEATLTQNGRTTDLFIVGNGLGLSWNVPTKLTKDSATSNTWSILFQYNATNAGSVCSSCPSSVLIPAGTNFQYRIMTSKNDDMIGANFGLPLASVSKSEKTFPPPLHFAYPYFFTKTGKVRSLNVTSTDNVIQTREWAAYFPASFDENPYKKYPVALSFDMGTQYLPTFMQPFIEEEVIAAGRSEEVVFIGSNDYRMYPTNVTQSDRFDLLTPSVGRWFYCKEGTELDSCNGCIPANLSAYEYFVTMRDKCGIPTTLGGKGDVYVDYALSQVIPAFNRLSNNRLLTDRRNMGVHGCSLGGMMACHTAWTRPEVFGHGVCQSPSFWWPMVDTTNLVNGFEFLNKTLKTKTGLRQPQTIFFDVTDGENEPLFDMYGAALQAYETMASVSPDSFRRDVNLWFVYGVGYTHCDVSSYGMIWMWLSEINKPGGGPKNPNPPPTRS